MFSRFLLSRIVHPLPRETVVSSSRMTGIQLLFPKVRQDSDCLQSAYLHCVAGDIVHILIKPSLLSHSTIEFNFSTPHLLILHPDVLVSATSVSTACSCLRKPLLQARLRTTAPPTPAVHFGNVLHELFQICLQKGRWDEAFVRETALGVIRRGVAKWWSIGMELDEALLQTLERSKPFISFADTFVRPHPNVRLSPFICFLYI
jgi:hypothetical protein